MSSSILRMKSAGSAVTGKVTVTERFADSHTPLCLRVELAVQERLNDKPSSPFEHWTTGLFQTSRPVGGHSNVSVSFSLLLD